MNKIRKLLKAKTVDCANYLNVSKHSIYHWDYVPPKYNRLMIEFLEGLAQDLLNEAHKLGQKEK